VDTQDKSLFSRSKGAFYMLFLLALATFIVFAFNDFSPSLKTQVTDPISGQCGVAAGQTFETQPPTSLLCSVGTASTVTQTADNKWIWQCDGLNGGSPSSCEANLPSINPSSGVCGPADGQEFDEEPPASLLCTDGIPTTPELANDQWIWQCEGEGGGNNVTCQTLKQTHFVCRNEQCVEEDGSGDNECSTDVDCQLTLENIFIVTNPFNDLVIEQSVQANGTVALTAVGTGNMTWNVRGSAGGELNTYIGNDVIYSPSDIRGEDIISVSNGIHDAYIYIEVDISGNGTPTFDVQLTNTLSTVEDFPLNVSVGVELDDILQFQAIGEFEDPETGDVSFRDITGLVDWDSDDVGSEVGEIFATGLFEPRNSGVVAITAELAFITSNSITIYVNPTFAEVNPSGYEPHFHPNPVAQGYTTSLWFYVEDDTNVEDISIVSADLSQLNITPACTDPGDTLDDCDSNWRLSPAEFENRGRWYFMKIRVPFTVPGGTYDIRVQATSDDGEIDRRVTIPLRVVTEVLRGDINGDGIVMIQDAIFALQATVGILQQSDRNINIFADVNGDGRIGMAEAIFILNHLAG
jgi:hypothetical protein